MNTYKLRLHSSLSRSILCIAATLAPVVALSGCAIGAASFPDASPNPAQIPLGPISGSDFGGHAPLIGAHVYVLQPSVTTATATNQQNSEYNAYAGRATSLLSATYQNNGQSNSNGTNYNATAQNTGGDPGVPTGWYYQTTDLTGAFNISGDYTCTAGLPVYLYLYGGSPTYPSANNTFPISNWTASGSSGAYTVTMTINTGSSQPIENAYIGETLTVASNTSATPTGTTGPFNGSFQVVTATNLTTTTFSFTYTGSALPNGASTGNNYAQTGTNMTVTFQPTFNTGVVNLAVLGNCPDSTPGNGTNGTGTFSGANAISYVFVNEVSTVAAAYAFRPFTFTPSTTNSANGNTYQTSCETDYNGTVYYWNNATCIGTSSGNVAGLQNAANIAKQLYDITGSQITTSYAGEGHIANYQTVNKNGIVPQANIDTLGNILAACVDSNNGSTVVGSTGNYNTSTGTYSGISPQCNTLFSNATSSAVLSTASSSPGIQAFDTAQAAFNIARHPAGTAASSSFVSNLYSLPQANVPFTPNLTTQPNDFTIGILYPASLNTATTPTNTTNTIMEGAESLAIDKIGNVWVQNQASKNGSNPAYLFELSPVGVPSNEVYNANYSYGYVVVDSGENVWTGASSGNKNTNTDVGVTYVPVTSSSVTTPIAGANPVTYTYGSSGTNTSLTEYATYASFADSLGNVYFPNSGPTFNTVTTGYILKLSGAASSPGTATATESAAVTGITTPSNYVSHAAMQSTSASAYLDFGATNQLTSVTLASTPVTNTGFPVTNATNSCGQYFADPEGIAVTRSGDALVAAYDSGGGSLNTASSSLFYIVSTSGACTQESGATLSTGLNSPFGIAIDGNDYAYITNRGGGTGTSISVLNMQSNTSSVTAVTPSNGYAPQYYPSGSTTLTYELAGPLNIATGPEGSVWITDYGSSTTTGNAIVQIVGLATPTITPIALGTTSSSNSFGAVGNRP